MNKCKKCGETLALTEFVKHKTNKTLLNKNLVYAGSYNKLDDAITARDNKLTILNQEL